MLLLGEWSGRVPVFSAAGPVFRPAKPRCYPRTGRFRNIPCLVCHKSRCCGLCTWDWNHDFQWRVPPIGPDGGQRAIETASVPGSFDDTRVPVESDETIPRKKKLESLRVDNGGVLGILGNIGSFFVAFLVVFSSRFFFC